MLQGLILVLIGLAALAAGLVAADSLGLIAGAIGILVVVVGGLQLLPGPGGSPGAQELDEAGRPLLQVHASLPTREPAQESGAGGTWRYEVRVGDTLWDIAAKQLGDPMRWVEIAELNYGRVQVDGRVFDDVRRLVAGWVLQMPEPAPGWVPERLADERTGDSGGVVRPFLPHLFDAGEEERETSGSRRVPDLPLAEVQPSEVGEAMEQWADELTGLGEIWPVVIPPDEGPLDAPSPDEPGAPDQVRAPEVAMTWGDPFASVPPVVDDIPAQEDSEPEPQEVADAQPGIEPPPVVESPTVIESWALWASHKPWANEQVRAETAGSAPGPVPTARDVAPSSPPEPTEEPALPRRWGGIRRLGLRRPEVGSQKQETPRPVTASPSDGDQLVQWAAAESERRRKAIDDLGRPRAPGSIGAPERGARPDVAGTRAEVEPLGLVSSRRARLFRRRKAVEGEDVGAASRGPGADLLARSDRSGRSSLESRPAVEEVQPVPSPPPPPPPPPPLPMAPASLGPIEIFRHRTRLPDVDETLRRSSLGQEPERALEPEPEVVQEAVPEPAGSPEPEVVQEAVPKPAGSPEPGPAVAPESRDAAEVDSGQLAASPSEPAPLSGSDVASASGSRGEAGLSSDIMPPPAPGLLTGGFGRLTPILPGEAVGEERQEPPIVPLAPEPAPTTVELQPVDEDVVNRLIGACHSWRSEWLSLAMRAAGRVSPESFDAVIGAFVGEDETLLVLARPTPAPAPIFEEAGELAWRLSTEITLDDLGEQVADLPSPCTTLVPLGWELDDDGVPGPLVLLALGAVRSLALGVPWARSLAEAIVSLGDVRFSAPWSDGRLRFVAEGDPMPADSAGGEQHLVVLGEVGGLEHADRRLGERRGTVVIVGEEPDAVLEVGTDGRVPMLRCRVGLDRTRSIAFGVDVAGVEAPSGAQSSLEVEVNVLGPLEVRASRVDRELLERNPQLRALLAALALRPNEPFDRLVKALWRARIPGRTERGKVIQLLQRALGADRRDAVVERSGRVYRIAFSLRSDLLDSLDDQGHLSARVLDRIRGPVLEGAELVDMALGEGTVEALRAEIRRLAVDVAVEARRVGDLPRAYRALERGVLASPRNEQIWVELLCCASLLSDGHLARATQAMLREWGVDSVDELPGSLPGLVRTLTP